MKFSPRHALPYIVLACAPLSACAAPTESPGSDKKPNIVIILADDLGWGELGCYGQEKIKTPNLDRMAAEGERWTQYYAGAATCAPSRNILLTGRHAGGVDVKDLQRFTELSNREKGTKLRENDRNFDSLKGDYPMSAKARTIHTALAQSGYDTAAFGKWGMGEYGTTGAPDKHGVGIFYGYTDHRMCHTFYPPFLWKNGVKDVINNPGVPGHDRLSSGPVDDAKYTGQVHASERIRDEMLRYIDEHDAAKNAKPFFIYYAPPEPHVAIQPPKAWVDKYPKEWDPVPYLGDKGYLPHSRPRAAYAATISYLDDNVGRLLKKLKDTGHDKDTLVIFVSDNGTTHDVGGVDHKFFNLTRTLSGLKGDNGEGGIRVPCIVRWPGKVPAGKVIDQPFYAPDIMPTLCAITGADAGATLGENLRPVILGEKPSIEKRRAMVWAGGSYGGQISVRMDDIKVTRRGLFIDRKTGRSKAKNWEVYDLSKDISEKTNLAATHREDIAKAVEVLKLEYTPNPDFQNLDYTAPEKPTKSAGE
jgi:arylsulfatase A